MPSRRIRASNVVSLYSWLDYSFNQGHGWHKQTGCLGLPEAAGAVADAHYRP